MTALPGWLTKSRLIYLWYTLVAILVMGPLLKFGYVLTLDMAWGPNPPWPSDISSSWPLHALLHILAIILPSQLIQKVLLLGILLLSGLGMHRLVAGSLKKMSWGALFAGLFYMINPFTYGRFMDGQYELLLGYALLPWFVQAWWRFCEQLSFKRTVMAAAWAVVICLASIHLIYMIALIMIGSLVYYSWTQRRQSAELASRLKLTAVMVLIVAVINSFWLIPFVADHTQESHQIEAFDARHSRSFRTVGDAMLGVPLNVAGLYGYWGEGQSRFVSPKSVMPVWPLLLVCILTVVVIGAVITRRMTPARTIPLIVVVILAWLVAWLAPLQQWLMSHLPYFSGYREPQKFAVVLALVFAYLGGHGVNWLITRLHASRRWVQEVVPLGLVLLPILYTPTMVWSFSNQLQAVSFPADWSAANDLLVRDRSDFRVLFLPWHQYLRLGFVDRLSANPAKVFFERPVIQADRPELGLIPGDAATPETAAIEELLADPASLRDAADRLWRLNVKYVVLAKEADWREYGYWDQQRDLKLIMDLEQIKVYQNLAFGAGP